MCVTWCGAMKFSTHVIIQLTLALHTATCVLQQADYHNCSSCVPVTHNMTPTRAGRDTQKKVRYNRNDCMTHIYMSCVDAQA